MMMKLLASTAMMAMAASTVSATTLFFKNSCEFQIDLYDNGGTHAMAPGATHTRYLAPGFKGMFRHGQNPQATLAEFTVLDGKSWFDISIIPTGPKSGPDYCPSLNDCKAHTGGVGYNVQMQIAPRTNSNGAHCRTLTCMYDGCPDAYQYPKDDTKTHNCPDNTDFDLTFCPGGKGGETPAPTTPAPTTPAPTTPEPTTPAPTNATEDRSMDALLESGVTDKSGAGSVGTVTLETPEPTPEPTTATPVGTSAAPAVEANTQSSASSGSGIAGTIVLVLGAMAAVAGVAMIVVIRRKKAALDAMEDKNDSIILRTSTAAL